ncbi:FG-GAP repeat domain-containing protein [Pseudoruegeria sp. SHC-113]|uniref:FG-GAP repeat domain-containing protein n=1 Tax=Pseudoruegeria sp. SHC-113 TaxID=2855439 RepID=UPI0021BA5973|nr:VCBS repeat-containing protein [Pseudoruegeria sp. SHC-113]MCT8159821.1 VCBS repeat-containing protein [Pseudoruegeria sp. SHC-113]
MRAAACAFAAALLAALPAGAAPVIAAATYDDPTTRYAHGVLGDAIEHGTLVLAFTDGSARRFVLPESRVFEDTAPRLADLDTDGAPEVIVVESDQRRGARLAVYGPNGLITATPYIGTANRWLAPIGAADLDGDGTVDIAYVDRPHLARVLRVWRFENGQLTEIAQDAGYSNHRIGEDFITGGIRTCAGGPELVLPEARWQRLKAVRLEGNRLKARDAGAFDGPSSVAAALACKER